MGVEPIHIEVDESIKPVQQKRRPVPLKYVERFEDLLDDLESKGVVSGPLDHKSATGWIHNPVIADKKYSNKIRLTLDTRPMAKAVKTAKFPIPTPTELRNKLRGSKRFSALDMRDSFFQFEMDEESSKLYTFWTTKGLYKFNTLAQGVSSASAETHDRIRRILAGLDGVIQIKDDMIVHREGENHDENLRKVFPRLKEHNITLNREKCHTGLPQVKWFGMIYSKQGMSKDPEKMEQVSKWKPPTDKNGVKSFLQTIQFCRPFLKPKGGKNYADVTHPLRRLTSKSVRFEWTEDCQKSFQELKDLLILDTAMAYYDPELPSRVYVDESLVGMASTLAQQHAILNESGEEEKVWCPVDYTSRTKTAAERGYGKVEGESLGLLHGILENKMYLYGTRFTVVMDHKPLVALYSSHLRSLLW